MKILVNLLLIVMILFGLTGCWSRKELNDIAVATALGIDKKDNHYLLTVQILNPGEIAGTTGQSNRSETTTYEKSGKTLFEAARNLTTVSPRKVYMSHIRIIVIGEELAEEGIKKILDFLSRDHEFRSDFFIVIAKDTSAGNLLKILTTLEKIPANKVFNSLKSSQDNWAPTKTVQLDELISSIVSKGKEPVLSGVYAVGDVEEGIKRSNIENGSHSTTINVDSIGAFKNDRLIGWLNRNESKGYNYITNNVKSTIATIDCKDGLLSIETIRTKTTVKGEVKQGKPKITIDVSTEGNIGEVACKINLSKLESIREIERKYEGQHKKMITAAIEKAQKEFQSDIFGFGDVIHRTDPKAWKRMEKNWDEIFSDLDVSIHIDAKIRRLGTITDSFYKNIKE